MTTFKSPSDGIAPSEDTVCKNCEMPYYMHNFRDDGRGQCLEEPLNEFIADDPEAQYAMQNNVRELLFFLGEDPDREGLLETPSRVSKAWLEWCSGYQIDPAQVLKTFEDGGENYDQMVTVRNIPFYSHCEHHLAPFFGTATISFVPEKRIVGLSKFSRLLDVFARRLQVQERLTSQIADALMEHLKPRGVGVQITARHLCMESRGIHKQGHETETRALRGVFLHDPSTRAEFMTQL